ncbi:MAG: dihydrolipoyl dehydrogenase [Methanomassiliicoccales archaeon]|jgi:dihydrolipoamide dehydrogenase|nr:dihydrolipoyl dehydrogenase [Methanomassiliicoccales archaeon]
MVKEYDLIVIGSGAGMNVVDRARRAGLRVALIENGPLGGTCLNRGCIPSKIWTYPADVIRLIGDSHKVGVTAEVIRTDYEIVRKRMWNLILHDRQQMERAVQADEELDFYHMTGYFIDRKMIQVGDEKIRAEKIMIACGARTRVPEIPGLEDAGYLTSETVFDIDRLPKSLVILGGGYKACEFAHFFSAFGTTVTIIGRNPRLLPKEEPEVSALVLKEMSRFIDIRVNQEVIEINKGRKRHTIIFKNRETGAKNEVEAEKILVATGVRSNADLVRAEAGGIALDNNGYIVVNQFLETNVPGVWAFGDVIGRNMYRHTANYESEIAWNNAFGTIKVPVDEHAVPHAVFCYPQVASVGLTEAEAVKRGYDILVGINMYSSCAKGYAMAEENGFVKVIVESATRKILGASIVGSEAAILLQSLVYLMNAGDQSYLPIARSQTIHPALSEAVVGAFARLHPRGHDQSHQ